MDSINQFRDAMLAAGLVPPETIEADGSFHRFASNGKRGDDAGWYVLYCDGIPAGSFGDWRTGLSQNWRAEIGRTLTPAEQAAHRERIEAMKREREATQERMRGEAANKAAAVWANAAPCTGHPYLSRKGIQANGARLYKDSLLIPLRAEGALHSLQFIGADGEKRFLTGGRVAGCYCSIGNTKGAEALCIVEGFATGATIHESTGHPVAVAFNAGNLEAVALAMRAKFSTLPIIVCADDDWKSEGNPGKTKATAAALAIGGRLAMPQFDDDRPEGATDFNDMAAIYGGEAVKQAIGRAAVPAISTHQPAAEIATAGVLEGWAQPLPLVATGNREPYPQDALPDLIREAVAEVQSFTKAPSPMVASSALAALSVATQAQVNVRRAEMLEGPSSLFLLTIADSGERKSTCDGFFTAAIKEFEAQQAEAARPAVRDYRAALDAWEAKRNGVKEAIRTAANKGKPTQEHEERLRDLENHKPEAPRYPRIMRGDETPENLSWVLATDWPSGAIVSAEAGIVFGAHAMGKDTAMRNLALLNVLWDGGSQSVGRRTSESYTLKGARLTVALQVQEATIRNFFERTGQLARGTGFLARFLVAWPESTQGYRPFTEAPESWPALARFNQRISEILALPVPIEGGALNPPALRLDPEAKAAWVAYHDTIEAELKRGGELYDVRDVASKSADNAARLAALFHVLKSDGGGAIGLDSFQRASRIAAWHLNDARRFFGEFSIPPELAQAAALDEWLIDYCRREKTTNVPIAKLQQGGPGSLRRRDAYAPALQELAEIDRARLSVDGKKKSIDVNPALLNGGVK